MHIDIIELTMQNFKSIGREVSINFESLSDFVLITGVNNDVKTLNDGKLKSNNGSGKSTIIDGIVFALFGKTLEQLSNKRLINRSIGNKLKTFARLKFKSGNDIYTSEAYLKGGKDPTVSFTLTKNDEPPIERNTPQMKEFIEFEILGCPFDLFKSSIVMSQSSYNNFYDMTKSQKISYIENLFKLTIFSDVLSLVRSDINSAKNEYNSANAVLLASSNDIYSLGAKSQTFNDDKNNRIVAYHDLLEAKLKILSNCQDLEKELTPTVDKRQIEVEASLHIDKVSQYKVSVSKYQSALAVLSNNINTLNASIIKHKEILDIACSECYGKADQLLNITKSKADIETAKSQILVVDGAIKSTRSKISEHELKLQELNLILQDMKSKDMKKQLNTKQIEFVSGEIENIKVQIEQISKSENPFEDLINNCKVRLDESKSKANEWSDTINMLSLLELAFSERGAKKMILSDLAENINSIIKHYLVQFGSNYTVTFDSNFGFEFVTPTGVTEYASFSSGEKQRINLATMFAFRDLITNNRISSNIFMLDEVLDNAIDEVAIQSITEILKGKSAVLREKYDGVGCKTLLTSHNPIVSNCVRSKGDADMIVAVKTNDETTYSIIKSNH